MSSVEDRKQRVFNSWSRTADEKEESLPGIFSLNSKLLASHCGRKLVSLLTVSPGALK